MTHPVVRTSAYPAVHIFCGKLVDNAVRTALSPVRFAVLGAFAAIRRTADLPVVQ
jgi:hypothetical protein